MTQEIGFVIYDSVHKPSESWGVLADGTTSRIGINQNIDEQVYWFEVQETPFGFGFNPSFFGINTGFLNNLYGMNNQDDKQKFGINLGFIQEVKDFINDIGLVLDYQNRSFSFSETLRKEFFRDVLRLNATLKKVLSEQISNDITPKVKPGYKGENTVIVEVAPSLSDLGAHIFPISDEFVTTRDFESNRPGFTMISIKQKPVNPNWLIKGKKDRWVSNHLLTPINNEFKTSFEHGFYFPDCRPLNCLLPFLDDSLFSRNTFFQEVIVRCVLNALINPLVPTVIDTTLSGYLSSLAFEAVLKLKEAGYATLKLTNHKIQVNLGGHSPKDLIPLFIECKLETMPLIINSFKNKG